MQGRRTPGRVEKIKEVLLKRQPDLNVIIENIHDPHNVSAIFRTCDAVGVNKIHLLYHIEKFPRLNNTSSSSASKWVDFDKYNNVDECFENLKSQGFKIYASTLNAEAKELYKLDLTGKVALLFGNEHRGVSEDAVDKSDGSFYIPMKGMVQSLNASVAAAVTLYEVLRQRDVKGLYDKSSFTDEEIESLTDQWCSK